VLFNIGLFVVLVIMNSTVASLLSPGILAYTYGLRHAVDADHIAAIDNATRKLIADGKRPLCVGLWFSLGHASVVVIMCVVVSLGSTYARSHLHSFQTTGAVVGTAVSATVLFAIGGFNMYIAWGLLKRWRVTPEEGSHDAADGHLHEAWEDDGHTHLVTVNEDAEVEGPGVLVKCCPRIFAAVDAEWKMYPIGFLFGLGFDTASEVAVLALAAIAPKDGMPPACVLILPLMFGAGMALIDTLDGMLMAYSYEFALSESRSKLFYNLYLTGVTGLIALSVGVIETLGCIQQEMRYSGPVWHFIGGINDNFEFVGYSIIGFFIVSLGLAVLYFKFCIKKLPTAEERRQRVAEAVPVEEKNDPAFRDDSDAIKNLFRRSKFCAQPAVQAAPVTSIIKGEQNSEATARAAVENGA